MSWIEMYALNESWDLDDTDASGDKEARYNAIKRAHARSREYVTFRKGGGSRSFIWARNALVIQIN